MGRIGRTLAHSVDHGKLQFLQKLPKIGKFFSKSVKLEKSRDDTGKVTKNNFKESGSQVADPMKKEVGKPLKERAQKEENASKTTWKKYDKQEGGARTGSVVMGAKDQKGVEIIGEDVFFDTTDGFNNVTFGSKKLHVNDDDDDPEFFDCTDDDDVLTDLDAPEPTYKEAQVLKEVEDSKKSEEPLLEDNNQEAKKPEGQVAGAKVEASKELKPKEVLPDKLIKQTLGEHFKETGVNVEEGFNSLGPLKSYGKSAYEKMAGMTIKELEHQGGDVDKLVTDLLGKWTSKVALPAIRKFMPSYKADAFSLMANWYLVSATKDHPHTEDLGRVIDKALSHCKDDKQKMELLENLVTSIAQKAYDEGVKKPEDMPSHYRDQMKVVFSKLQHKCGNAGKDFRAELSMDDNVLLACGNRRISSSEL